MVYVNYIKFHFHIVLGAPPPILDISSNIFPWFIDTPGFNIVISLNITIVVVSYFIVGEGMVSVTLYSLDFCKDRLFLSLN